MSIVVKQSPNYRTQFFGIHIPMGAVYAILPETRRNGRTLPKSYVWVENLTQAYNHRHFTVRMLTVNDSAPRSVYVDGDAGYARILRNFIRALPMDKLRTTPTINKSEIRAIGAPKDRTVGKYILRGVPSFETSPKVMTENSVTAGVRVGPVWLTEEGYKKQCMGLDAPDYNRNRPTPVHKSDDLESLSLDVSF